MADKQVCYFDILEYIKAIAPVCTMIIAFCAYRIGKAYFNKGHRNTINIQRYNKKAEQLDKISAALADVETSLLSILDSPNTPSPDIELQKYAEAHDELMNCFKQGQFIPEVLTTKKLYLNWYSVWFENPSSTFIQGIFDSNNRTMVIKQIHPTISGDFKKIKNDLAKIYEAIIPKTDI